MKLFYEEPFTGNTQEALNIIHDDLVQSVPTKELGFYEQVFESIQEATDARDNYLKIATKRISEMTDEKHELKMELDDAKYNIMEKNEKIDNLEKCLGNAESYIKQLEMQLAKEGK